jgi:flagellar M-ring protein FliF
VGAERFRAGVTVECDFTSGEQSEETLDPNRSVMLQSQRTEDLSGPSAQAAGVPGTPSNLARPQSRPGGSAGGVSRRTENIAYQTSRTVRRVKMPQGEVKRISVALLLDHTPRFEGTGAKMRRILVPPPAESVKAIRDLVTGVAGLRTDRGDQLVVESLPFESNASWTPPTPVAPTPAAPPMLSVPAWLLEAIQNRNMVILGALGGVAVLSLLLATGGLLWWRKRRKKAKGAQATMARQPAIPGASAAALPGGASMHDRVEAQIAEHHATKERQEQEMLASLRLPPVTTKKGEVLVKHLAEEAKKNPDGLAQIVRTWISEAER